VLGAPKLCGFLRTGAHGALATPKLRQDFSFQSKRRQCAQKLVKLHSMGITSMTVREHVKNHIKES